MFSRKTTKKLAELMSRRFGRVSDGHREWIDRDAVYDFCFENGFDAHFCNTARERARTGVRPFVDFVMQLHTGEAVAHVRPGDPAIASEAQGQHYLRHLAEALLCEEEDSKREARGNDLSAVMARARSNRKLADPLLRSLELDGYVFRERRLLHVESAIVDVDRQHNALEQLASDLELGKLDILKTCLSLSEEHYAAGRWRDCINNSRLFLELCLQECAAVWSARHLRTPIAEDIYSKPVKVRFFLVDQKLLSDSEGKTIAETYSLLSETGSHPNMAESDHARLLRQVALLYSEFAMLRAKGALSLSTGSK
jgi:hypothetical protein